MPCAVGITICVLIGEPAFLQCFIYSWTSLSSSSPVSSGLWVFLLELHEEYYCHWNYHTIYLILIGKGSLTFVQFFPLIRILLHIISYRSCNAVYGNPFTNFVPLCWSQENIQFSTHPWWLTRRYFWGILSDWQFTQWLFVGCLGGWWWNLFTRRTIWIW